MTPGTLAEAPGSGSLPSRQPFRRLDSELAPIDDIRSTLVPEGVWPRIGRSNSARASVDGRAPESPNGRVIVRAASPRMLSSCPSDRALSDLFLVEGLS